MFNSSTIPNNSITKSIGYSKSKTYKFEKYKEEIASKKSRFNEISSSHLLDSRKDLLVLPSKIQVPLNDLFNFKTAAVLKPF